MIPVLISNYTDVISNFFSWSMQGYIDPLYGFLFYPLMFCGVVGYVYMKQQSLVAAAIAILILVVFLVNLLVGVNVFISLLHIAVAFIISGLLLLFFLKARGN